MFLDDRTAITPADDQLMLTGNETGKPFSKGFTSPVTLLKERLTLARTPVQEPFGENAPGEHNAGSNTLSQQASADGHPERIHLDLSGSRFT